MEVWKMEKTKSSSPVEMKPQKAKKGRLEKVVAYWSRPTWMGVW
jgi:hypothetical protein